MINQLQLAWARRDVIQYLVVTELRTTYRNKMLGYLWTLLDPLMMMGVYILLVVGLFGRGGPQFPVLLFSSLLAWWWFAQTLSASVDAISGKGRLIKSIAFAKITLPIAKVLVGLAKYVFGLTMLIPFLIAYHANWSAFLLYLPLLIVVQFMLTLGLCLVASVLGVYFKDIQNVLKFSIRAMFFMSPALYSAYDRVPERFMGIYMLNPFAALFESYKNVLVYGKGPDAYMGIAVLIAIACLVGGLWVFNKWEPELAKQI